MEGVLIAQEYFEKLLNTDKKDAQSLCLCALFYSLKGENTEAESFFLKALTETPEYGFGALEFIKFLCNRRLIKEAKKMERLMARFQDLNSK